MLSGNPWQTNEAQYWPAPRISPRVSAFQHVYIDARSKKFRYADD